RRHTRFSRDWSSDVCSSDLGTIDDMAWWLGATKATVRTALDDLAAVRVSLENGSVGWLREDDIEPVRAPEPWVALLPLLDPTVRTEERRVGTASDEW